ncbi:hypothetical protein ARMSODRAFT_983633 [Armillaria solidipes]|uniref:Uncharacterized protein n=1 Tax=Armillaria solidipes TaxID=1076256 RepID=A0A2H3AY34_9AGAR|nr:hypothetical protein ARMSODRAFT_983633 [Armillaria solidipes]
MSYQPDQPAGSPDPRFGNETVVINEQGKSAMQELWEEYNASQHIEGTGTEPHPSTSYRVQYYGEYELQAIDVVGREYDRFTTRPQYTLRPELLETIKVTIMELQTTLAVAAGMIPHRIQWFHVDPQGMFLDILNGSDNVRLLNAAWKGLAGRLCRGHRFMVKYVNEFERRIRVPSPVSTAIGAYDELETENGPEGEISVSREELIWLPENEGKTTEEQGTNIPSHETAPSSSATPLSMGPSVPYKPTTGSFFRLSAGRNDADSPHSISEVFKERIRHSRRNAEPSIQEEEESEESASRTPMNKGKGRALEPEVEEGDSEATKLATFAEHAVPTSVGLATAAIPRRKLDYALDILDGSVIEILYQRIHHLIHHLIPTVQHHQVMTRGNLGGRGEVITIVPLNLIRVPPPANRRILNESKRQGEEEVGEVCWVPEGKGVIEANKVGWDQEADEAIGALLGHLAIPVHPGRPGHQGELKPEHLPTWDGNPYSAILYFWKVMHLSSLGGRMPEYLGQWLWKGLKEESDVYTWFSTLATVDQEYMRENIVNFLTVIKDDFLGDQWQVLMNDVFEAQQFRQRRHENESPQGFITCRTMYTRMLMQVNDGGAMEVNIIMRKALIAWRPILNMSTIASTKQLLARVIEHSKSLVHAATRNDANSRINTGELINALHSIGIDPPRRSRFATPKSANIVSNASEEGPSDEAEGVDLYEILSDSVDESNPSDSLLRSAYQVLKKRQRPLPKQYYFPISNKETKLGKPPPSPCKVCSSPKHWDRECPHWDEYIEKMRKTTAQLATLQINADVNPEDAYRAAYQALSMELRVESETGLREEDSDFCMASRTDEDCKESSVTESKTNISKTCREPDDEIQAIGGNKEDSPENEILTVSAVTPAAWLPM